MNNKYLVWGFFFLLAFSAFLLGKTTSPKTNIGTTPIPTEEDTAIIPKPTSAPTLIYKNQTPSPTQQQERKKVAVTLSDAALSGTFYCYEDKANEIMTIQNNLNMAMKTGSICVQTKSNEIKWCFNKCGDTTHTCISNCLNSPDQTVCNNLCLSQGNTCTDACPKGTECDNYTTEVSNLRSQLIKAKNNYCP